jgi:hypothetical protein
MPPTGPKAAWGALRIPPPFGLPSAPARTARVAEEAWSFMNRLSYPDPCLARAYAQSDRMVGRRISGEYVLVPIVGRGADVEAIFSLNRLGAFIWERLDGRTDGTTIVEEIVGHHTIDRESATHDYLQFLRGLLSVDAVRQSPAEGIR